VLTTFVEREPSSVGPGIPVLKEKNAGSTARSNAWPEEQTYHRRILRSKALDDTATD
jgi:hypothetical protein